MVEDGLESRDRRDKKVLTISTGWNTLYVKLGCPNNNDLGERSSRFNPCLTGGIYLSHLRSSVAHTVLVVALVVAAFGAVAYGQGIEIEHELGTTVVPANPQRVVVFDFGVLDSLDKLGIDVIGLPKGSIPSYLSKYNDAKYANVGSFFEPDFETINALKPDIIIISGRTASEYDRLSTLAPTVYMGTNQDDYFGSVETNLRHLGRIFGVEDEVEAEIAQIKQSIEDVKSLASGKNALVLLATGGRANAYGPGSRYGFIFDELGIEPANDDVVASTHGQVISWEFVLVNDPDYIFVIDRDAVVSGGSGQTAKQVVENELVKLTKAYENGNIVYLDPNYWYLSGGGLSSLAMMVDDVKQALSH